jgi:uroporphyrinogen-III synthase
MRVLLTRPLDAAQETADALRARGHDALIEPLLTIVNEPGPVLDVSAYALLVLTSANGARAAAARMEDRTLPVLAVGPATAAEARKAGFSHVQEADGNGTDGIMSFLARMPRASDRPILHVSGTEVAGDLQAKAQQHGLKLERKTLYRAVAAEALSPGTCAALRNHEIDAAMFFSPRTAEIFASLVARAASTQHLATITACVISHNAAKALKPLTFRKVLVAQDTTVGAMLGLLDDM